MAPITYDKTMVLIMMMIKFKRSKAFVLSVRFACVLHQRPSLLFVSFGTAAECISLTCCSVVSLGGES